MKGIVLAGGHGRRMEPLTRVTSKQLLPVYDKPLIYYSMSTLFMADIKEILLISKPEHQPGFEALFGDGHQLGIHIEYASQPSRGGIAEALLIAKDFIGDDTIALALGDNIFYGSGFKDELLHAKENAEKGTATLFGYRVEDPENYGVVDFDAAGNAISLEEKPQEPRSNYCVTGLYFYDNRAVEFAQNLTPATNGELEITDLNRCYLDEGSLKVELLPSDFAWFDTGTVDSLFNVSEFIRVVQNNTGVKVAALEEMAYNAGWIRRAQLLKLADSLKRTEYGRYLEKIALSSRR